MSSFSTGDIPLFIILYFSHTQPHHHTYFTILKLYPKSNNRFQLQAMCQIAWSEPRAKTSRRLGPATTVGCVMIVPLRVSQEPHAVPLYARCQHALSMPTAKMSIRLGPRETAVAGDTSVGSLVPLLRFSHDDQLPLFEVICHNVL